MSKLILPQFQVGMIVVSPAENVPHITKDKYYVILDVEPDWIQIQDDTDEIRYYQSHLFIEADVYYNMCMWISLMRLFDIDVKDM